MRWDDDKPCPAGHLPVHGTRFRDAACIPFSCSDNVPDNAYHTTTTTGCAWACDAGFNNTFANDDSFF
jgi:hypothetical protein